MSIFMPNPHKTSVIVENQEVGGAGDQTEFGGPFVEVDLVSDFDVEVRAATVAEAAARSDGEHAAKGGVLAAD
jgi:pyrimidine deaminase RibD-like protein